MPTSSTAPTELPDAERLRLFGEAIDRVRTRIESQLGEDDVLYVKRLNAFSRAMEIVGRALIHVSLDPITWMTGVTALFVHKQLQATEIGHTALHGAYDKLEGAEAFRSRTFEWDVPIDEESWRYGHNMRHHGNTNVAGRDPDIHFGPVRLTDKTPWSSRHASQLAFTLFILFPNFTLLMNAHFTGIVDLLDGNGLPGDGLDFLPDRSSSSVRLALKRAMRKYVPYYFRNYVFFPALAGPFFAKVLAGNWLAETMRDIYSAATIFCGHVGEHTKSWPVGTSSTSRGAWYAMQVEAANDFEVSLPISVLCGGLDRQIEHHLFPRLPPHRLREIAPEIERICAEHGVEYRKDTWGRTLLESLRHVARLSKPTAVLAEMA